MTKEKKFYWKNTTGLTLAAFGHCIFITLTSMALPMFFTDVMYISPEKVSAIFLVTRIWDAVNDPIMGSLVDRTHTKWGKCRPYLMYSSFPLFIFTILMFTPLSISSETGKFVYALITYVLFITSFTMVDIPLAGLKSLLYTEPEERNKAMSFSSTFGSLGSLLALDLFFIFVVLFGGGNDKKGYFITVLFLAIIAFASLQGGFFTVREVIPVSKKKGSFFTTMLTVLKNKHLIMIIAVQLCSIAIGAYGMMLPYFSKWNLANSFSFGKFSVESILIPALSTATGVVYMIAVMITPYILKIGSKKKMFIAMSAVGFVLNVISFLCGYENMFVFIALRVLAHIPPTITATIAGYMVMDCLDYAEYETGERTEGSTFAVNNLIMKIGNAVFSSLVMLILGLVGYDAAVNEPALRIGEHMMHNYPEMLNGIYALMTGVPAIGCLLQMIAMFFYKLDDSKVNSIVAELKVRRSTAVSEQNGGEQI
ncbi:MAG: glycoside-pentoside-hexuronide (GPH):cation symporter [Clostridia bacterium]|nr:glycoside-pentoside-hexuronide (GPH):cation symporter [Clostridia bacterium]